MWSYFFGDDEEDGEDDIIQSRIITLRFMCKRLIKESSKAKIRQLKFVDKLKESVRQNDCEIGEIYAENALREKQTVSSLLKTVSKLEAIQSMLRSCMITHQVTDAMKETMNTVEELASVENVFSIVDGFENSLEDLQMSSNALNKSLQGPTGLSIDKTDVNSLLSWAVDLNTLENDNKVPSVIEMKSSNRIYESTL